MDLKSLGWDPWFQQFAEMYEQPQCQLARVVREERGVYGIRTLTDEAPAQAAGRLRHNATTDSELPAVGDWVVVRAKSSGDTVIEAVLPRRSCLSRKVPGKRTEEQVLAANIDTLFICIGLDHNYNPRRIERYLTLAESTGTLPVVVLNKADLCETAAETAAEAQRFAGTAPVHLTSGATGTGVEALRGYLCPSQTAVFLGSSGVGKSTLINQLLGGQVQATGEVRGKDSRGRHTTTTRQLLLIPDGGAIIDTPGLRELQLWTDAGAIASSFEDIAELATHCHFRDCRHQAEPRCAVRQAVESGELPPERLASYHRQQREVDHLSTRQDQVAQRAENNKTKIFHKHRRQYMKDLKKRGHE